VRITRDGQRVVEQVGHGLAEYYDADKWRD
jgi:hypothetical protein